MADNQWGRRIKGFRKLKGMTQVEFAKRMNMSVSVLGELERGARKPSRSNLEQIAETLDITFEEIAYYNQEEDLYV
ncbi:transcriptional regulator [Thalassobacillus devorans]|uniref:Transcriptional regulator n=1 Tax=Thalassobacillus devorans TaxID=279813 RepID=A0ABQ1PUP9_9BACI|nr:helix-turn-helix transcriptional regulator [Thalassobacillus devorans]NIK30824.1 transcriptional regulator with XRE-family HTH domain [Thalassobacillus devorans]GGD04544.1 transcriptional regulator [Thalassobacillus devorans]